jgi:hypothetical protein
MLSMLPFEKASPNNLRTATTASGSSSDPGPAPKTDTYKLGGAGGVAFAETHMTLGAQTNAKNETRRVISKKGLNIFDFSNGIIL